MSRTCLFLSALILSLVLAACSFRESVQTPSASDFAPSSEADITAPPPALSQPPLESFSASVAYDPATGELRFTVPEALEEGQSFRLFVSGRLFMDRETGAGMSWHGFETETEAQSWIPGTTYRETLEPEALDFLSLNAFLLSGEDELDRVAVTVTGDGAVTVAKESETPE